MTNLIQCDLELISALEFQVSCQNKAMHNQKKTLGVRFDSEKANRIFYACNEMIAVLKGERLKQFKPLEIVWVCDMLLFKAKANNYASAINLYSAVRAELKEIFLK